jgi:catalase
VLIRFSNGSGNPNQPDFLPQVRGMAVKFSLPDVSRTDISAQTARLFSSRTVEGFLEFVQAAKPRYGQSLASSPLRHPASGVSANPATQRGSSILTGQCGP